MAKVVKGRARPTVRKATSALPDHEGKMPRRISRKRRVRRRKLSRKKEEERRKKLLAREHPVSKIVIKKRKRMRVKEGEGKKRKGMPRWEDLPQDERTRLDQLIMLPCRNFLNAVRNMRRGRARFIRSEYRRVFDQALPKWRPPLELVKDAVGYQLLMNGFAAAGVRAPDRVRQNHAGAVAFSPSMMTPSMQGLHSVEGITEEAIMAAKKTKGRGGKKATNGAPAQAQGKKSGKGVAQFIIDLLKSNSKKKLTDDQLAKAICQEFPDRTRYKGDRGVPEVRMRRSEYNRGVLGGMDGAPAKASVPYDKQGKPEEVKRGRKPGTAAATKKKGGKAKRAPGKKSKVRIRKRKSA